MRKELIESEIIEQYLLHRLPPQEQQAFKTAMLIDPALAEKAEAQAGVYKFIKHFWRRQTRQKLSHIFSELMQETAFRQQLP